MSEQKQKKARTADAYEAAYMGADEDVLHREKLSYPRWFRILMPLLMTTVLLAASAGSIVAGDALVAVIAGMLIPVALLGLLVMSTLRVTVTSKNLHVQYGVVGPSIPLSAIEHCEAEHYSVWKYGGYGIRYSITEKAWCYNMLGDKGQAVRIHWRDAKGKLRKTLIASETHIALAGAINRARAVVAGTASPDEDVVYQEDQQVDLSDGVAVEDDLSLEEELAAVEEALAEVVEA